MILGNSTIISESVKLFGGVGGAKNMAWMLYKIYNFYKNPQAP